MTEPDAIAAKNEIEAVCKKHSLFRSVQEIKKPYLDQIKIEVSIKVDRGK